MIITSLLFGGQKFDLGPGPQDMVGDLNVGYFGVVSHAELFTGNQLASLIGLTDGIPINDTAGWLKFALDGRILYVAKKLFRYNLKWYSIYKCGAVNGDDTYGIYTKTPRFLQNRRVTKDGLTYKVRLLKGIGAAYLPITIPGDIPHEIPETNGSEWNRLMYKVHYGMPSAQKGPNLANFSDIDLGLRYPNNEKSKTISYCQELCGPERNMVFSRGGWTAPEIFSHSTTDATTFSNNNFGWRPVLELEQR